jgi:8-oxo-dGTP pyrophosphatase MutT (NUDIX family)
VAEPISKEVRASLGAARHATFSPPVHSGKMPVMDDRSRTSGPPRPAATIVLARAAPGHGVEVLVLRRSEASRFAPGFVVFPGGAEEPGDDELARRWFDSPDERARACAVRELAEETGLRIVATIDELPEIGRWIAPEFLPVRFDARFFAAAADLARGSLEPTPDGLEIVDAWWVRPADLLVAGARGDAPLAWPTMRTLEALAACFSVPEVLALRVAQEPPATLGRAAPTPSRLA